MNKKKQRKKRATDNKEGELNIKALVQSSPLPVHLIEAESFQLFLHTQLIPVLQQRREV